LNLFSLRDQPDPAVRCHHFKFIVLDLDGIWGRAHLDKPGILQMTKWQPENWSDLPKSA
jgi:hypothetical protein